MYDAVIEWWIHVHLFKPIECTTPRGNSNVNHGLWVIMTRLYSFTGCNECTPVVRDAEMGEVACGKAGNIQELYFLFNFAGTFTNCHSIISAISLGLFFIQLFLCSL